MVNELLPNARTERASIDEFFLDLSRDIYDRLLQQYGDVLHHPPPGNGGYSQHLPLPPPRTQPLDWSGSHLVANPDEEAEADAPQTATTTATTTTTTAAAAAAAAADLDWDDIAMAIGADIVRHVRTKVFSRLGYTCSAGVANNKMMAKLGSGFKKPNQQVTNYQCHHDTIAGGGQEKRTYSCADGRARFSCAAISEHLQVYKE